MQFVEQVAVIVGVELPEYEIGRSLVIMNMTLQDNVNTISVKQPAVNASKSFGIRTSIGT
ncbi:MAG TPA: hypothetical protein VLD84_10430 [Nitrososphaeraceae archaeon]|nr:hypothetical protein [Nitrososphaeraceae archaeon]